MYTCLSKTQWSIVSLVQISEDFEMFWGSVWYSVEITYWLYSETVHVLTITADTDRV